MFYGSYFPVTSDSLNTGSSRSRTASVLSHLRKFRGTNGAADLLCAAQKLPSEEPILDSETGDCPKLGISAQFKLEKHEPTPAQRISIVSF